MKKQLPPVATPELKFVTIKVSRSGPPGRVREYFYLFIDAKAFGDSDLFPAGIELYGRTRSRFVAETRAANMNAYLEKWLRTACNVAKSRAATRKYRSQR